VTARGVDCTGYDEELQQVVQAKSKLLEQKAKLEREGRDTVQFDRRAEERSGSWSR